MSYLRRCWGSAVPEFLSAATGIVVVIALIRGFVRHTAATIGNVWVDTARVTFYLLLPLSMIFAVFLVGQGVIQNFDAYKDVTTMEDHRNTILPNRCRWPASQG